jgi:integrase/recombinase XerD
MKPQQVEKIVRRVGERAGIEGLTPHRLRRTFGSFFLNEGVRLESVSHLLGHADTRITQLAYASLQDETVRKEMMEALSA